MFKAYKKHLILFSKAQYKTGKHELTKINENIPQTAIRKCRRASQYRHNYKNDFPSEKPGFTQLFGFDRSFQISAQRSAFNVIGINVFARKFLPRRRNKPYRQMVDPVFAEMTLCAETS